MENQPNDPSSIQALQDAYLRVISQRKANASMLRWSPEFAAAEKERKAGTVSILPPVIERSRLNASTLSGVHGRLAWDVSYWGRHRLCPRCSVAGPEPDGCLAQHDDWGRRQGVMCALGHGLGFGIYAGMAVFGLHRSAWRRHRTFPGLQLIGCLLLGWYGWSMWHANHDELFNEDFGSGAQGFAEGFASRFNSKNRFVPGRCLGASSQPDMNLLSRPPWGCSA